MLGAFIGLVALKQPMQKMPHPIYAHWPLARCLIQKQKNGQSSLLCLPRVRRMMQQYLMANFMLLVDGIWAMARKETTAGITMA